MGAKEFFTRYIYDEEDPKGKSEPKPGSPEPKPDSTVPATITIQIPRVTPIPKSTISEPDPNLASTLFGSLSHLQAYAQLSGNIETLAEDVPDEASRYKLAIKLTVKGGVTLDRLLSDYDAGFAILAEKEQEFQKEAAAKKAKRVDARRQASVISQGEIETRRAQIREIEAQISELEKRVQSESTAADEEERKLEDVRARFSVTLSHVRQVLEAQKTKVTALGRSM